MAIIDPRILPLVETLVEAGADRLAFEILEGVIQGEVQEEPHEFLGLEELVTAPLPRSRVGNDQLVWAADYVNKRLSDALTMLNTSFDQIDEILSTPFTQERPPAARPTHDNTIVVLQQDDERELSVNRQGLETARPGLDRMRQALNAWLEHEGIQERIE